jgi:phage terminase small subunit
MSEQSDAAKAALKILSPQRRKFVEEFCILFSATKAAVAAKYSKKTARTQGSRLLTFVDIKNAIKAVLDTSAMDPEEIAARWMNLARAGLDDFYTKEEYNEATKVQQPLAEHIAEKRRAMEFEQKVFDRLKLELPEDGTRHFAAQRRRENEIIRLEVELEENPKAMRTIDGPPIKKYRIVLDLVKAADLGLLDLAKAITPTEFGMKVELRSPDAALDNLAKWRGMLTTKIDMTSGGQPLPAPALLGVLTLEQKKQLLEARRLLQKQQEGASNG